jgi:hypothetical protein
MELAPLIVMPIGAGLVYRAVSRGVSDTLLPDDMNKLVRIAERENAIKARKAEEQQRKWEREAKEYRHASNVFVWIIGAGSFMWGLYGLVRFVKWAWQG